MGLIKTRTRPRIALCIAAMLCLFAGALGCGSTGATQLKIAEKMRVGDFPGALLVVEGQKTSAFGGKNRLLYFLERGMLLHDNGEYEASNAAFEQAKRIGEALYTESLSNIGFSLVSNDYALDYAGENFERTLIHLFAALNYASLGQSESALVEVRQVGEYLRKLQVDSPNENVYQEDAFARYLSALFYESHGELDSAFVDYKKAALAYLDYEARYSVSRPASLFANAERVAQRLGPWAQSDLRELGAGASPKILPSDAGEVVIFHYNGLSPIKGQNKYTIPFSEAWLVAAGFQALSRSAERSEINRAVAISSQISGYDVISVAFPKFVDRPYGIVRMVPKAPHAIDISTPELVEDIGEIAKRDLADRIVRIRAKVIARAAFKYALQKAAEAAIRESKTEYSDLFEVATQLTGNIVRYASEQADKRVWSTLPDQIWMSSVILPAGEHDLTIEFRNAQQSVVESRSISGVQVTPGSRQFIIVRTVK